MTKKDKIGLAIIVGVFAILGTVYVLTTTRPESASGTFTDNPIVERRMQTLDGQR